jgi:hypothetical protein
MPQALPPATRFGTLNPSVTTGGRFTGASVPGAQNMVHPEPPPTFQAPTYASGPSPAPGRALAPIVAALMATGIRSPLSSGGGGGATAAPLSTPRAVPQPGYPTSTQIVQGTANASTYPSNNLNQEPFAILPYGGVTSSPIIQKLGKTYRL